MSWRVQFVVTVAPRPCKVVLSVAPWPDGAALVPPERFTVLPLPHNVVPLLPSKETSRARIPLTVDCVSFWPDKLIVVGATLNVPTVPRVTVAKLPRPVVIVTFPPILAKLGADQFVKAVLPDTVKDTRLVKTGKLYSGTAAKARVVVPLITLVRFVIITFVTKARLPDDEIPLPTKRKERKSRCLQFATAVTLNVTPTTCKLVSTTLFSPASVEMVIEVRTASKDATVPPMLVETGCKD